MLLRLKAVLFLVLFGLTAAAVADTPNLVLKDLQGRDRNVNEFIGKGKWVVAAIWAHDCPVCKREIHEMAFFYDKHRKKGDATVLGISIDGYDNKALAQQFIDDHALDFPNLIGTPEDVRKLGGGPFIGTPTFYIFNPKGTLVGKNIGPLTQEEVEKFIKQQQAQG